MSNTSEERKKAEALSRMRKLGVSDQTIRRFDESGKIRLFLRDADLFIYVDENDLRRVRAFELRYNALVFAVIRNFTNEGMLDSYLFVSDYPEEWADDRRLLKNGEAVAYVYNHDAPYCSDVGSIGIMQTVSGGLYRTW